MKDNIKSKIKNLKIQSGTHSPSIDSILSMLPEINIKVDACFLSNPYATDLFMTSLSEDFKNIHELRNILEYYPPQNKSVAKIISKVIGIGDENIFVGNGAIEIIQAVIHNFVRKKIVIILPTFSSYYEFVRDDTEVVFYQLDKDNEYKLDVQKFVDFINFHKPDSLVLINPNNPNGWYINILDLKFLLESCRNLDNVILDESFVHFANEDEDFTLINNYQLFNDFNNLIIIKSMSKDFGIAGLRAGYAVMRSECVRELLSKGYLWNISGLTNYFFKKYADKSFQLMYDSVRKLYIKETIGFYKKFSTLSEKYKVYPTSANFLLVELLSEIDSFEFSMELLLDNGLYVRDCSDKIGLEGKFLRVASRTREENEFILETFRMYSK